MRYSLPHAYAVFCGRFIIAVNCDYLYAPKQGKLAPVCLQRFSYIFETSVMYVVYPRSDSTKLFEEIRMPMPRMY